SRALERTHPDPPARVARMAGRTHHGDRGLRGFFRPPLSKRQGRGGERRRRAAREGLKMKRFLVPLVPLVVFALLALVLAIGIRHSPDKGIIVSPLLGKPAPQSALRALLDPPRTVRSQDLQGHWYLQTLRAHGPCRFQ